MDTDDLSYYIDKFSHLHTARYKGKAAPHKAVLLLSVIELIEQGTITSNRVELSDALVEKFKQVWERFKGTTSIFTPDIGKPYFHMHHEPFWHLVEEGEEYSMVAESLGLIQKTSKQLPSRSSYSVKSLRNAFCYAELATDLYELLLDHGSREVLKETLINSYLVNQKTSSPSMSIIGIAAPLLHLLAS